MLQLAIYDETESGVGRSSGILLSHHFIDTHMKDANEAQMKIYLYLVRMICAGRGFSVADIADIFNYMESDVVRALQYWERKGLVSLDYDYDRQLKGVHLLPVGVRESGSVNVAGAGRAYTGSQEMSASARHQGMQQGYASPQQMHEITAQQMSAPVRHQQMQEITASQMHEIAMQPGYQETAISHPQTSMPPADNVVDFASLQTTKPASRQDAITDHDAQIQESIFIAEQYFGKTLSVKETEVLRFIHSDLGLSKELVEFLLEMCAEKGKDNFRYIQKIAMDWAEEGITTILAAKERAEMHDGDFYTIMRAVGKYSVPVEAEKTLMKTWLKEFGFPLETVLMACELAVKNTDNHRLAYANSILKRWHDAGAHTKAEVEALPKHTAAKAGANSQSGAGSSQSSGRYTSASRSEFNNFEQRSYNQDELERKWADKKKKYLSS